MTMLKGHVMRHIGAIINSIFKWFYQPNADSMNIWGILYRCRPPIGANSEDNFIMYHKNTAHASEILKKNNHVLSLTKSEVYLVECDSDVYDVSQHSFFYNAIFDEAIFVKSLRIEDFLAYVESLDDPAVDVLFLWSIGRCGSTMLAACFEALDDCASISEPMDMFVPWLMKDVYEPKTYQRLLEATLKFHLYQVQQRKPETKLVLIKPYSFGFWYAVESRDMHRYHHIFMYRDLKPFLISATIFGKISGTTKRHSLTAKITNFEKFVDETIMPLIKISAQFSPDKTQKIEEILEKEMCTLNCLNGIGTALLYNIYTQLVNHDRLHLLGVKYEDVSQNVIAVFEQILTHINREVNEEEMKRVVESTKKDSQANTALSSFNKTKQVDHTILSRYQFATNVLNVLDLGYMCEKGAKLPKTISL